ncbi:MAG: molybdopterin-dependent oxidoreductase [Steroidobacteraceae bacterium]
MDAPVKKDGVWEDVRLKTTCYGCPAATCGMIARRVNGVVVEVSGDPDCPFSQGKLCAKGQSQIMMAYSRRRVTKCLKRTNPEKGIGVDPKWVEISYDEAIRISAEQIRKCHETDPTGFVWATGDFSTLQWFMPSVLTSFGSPNHQSGGRSFCGNNVHPTLQQVHGGFHVCPDFHHAKHVILFGSNKGTLSNWASVTATTEMSRARLNGMKLVVVDPWCSNAASVADEWVPIRPGTDGALVLAMINLLVNEYGLYDVEFVRNLTNGPYLTWDGDGHYVRDPASNKPMLWDTSDNRAKCYDDPTLKSPALEGSFQVEGRACTPAFQLLRKHLTKFSPEYASEITTVPVETIRHLARDFGTAASIGSTIEIEGHTLPLRPACAHWYKGVSQHAQGYEQALAIAMLNTIVGAIDVPGGLLADTVYAHHPQWSENSTWMGRGSGLEQVDGLVSPGKFATYGGNFPDPLHKKDAIRAPVTNSADELVPAASYQGGLMGKMNILEPGKFNDKIPHATGVYVQVVSNDLLNEGNPKVQVEYHRKFAFQLSLVPNIDETAEMADVIIPTQTQLERLDMGANNIPDTMGSTGNYEYCINLRQPVVPTEVKHSVDIWIDLAEKAGLLPNFNQVVNMFLELHGENKLQPDAKYDNRELMDRWIRSMTGGDRSLDDVAKEGRIHWPKTVQERFPRPFYKSRIPVYYEYFLETGERIKAVTQSLGIKWDVSRYRPLVDWYPGPGHINHTPGYELHAVTYKWPFLTGTFSNFNPWLAELAQYHPYVGKIVLNRKYAEARGIRDGDRVRAENLRGRIVEGFALLSECIHPECVGMDHAGGNWAKSLPPRRKDTGVQAGVLFDYEMKNLDVMDGAFEASPKLKVTRIG